MSSFVSDVAGTLEPNISSPNDNASSGQRHDRIQNTQQDAMASSSTQDISTTQRMISATWGSILTVLLSKILLCATRLVLISMQPHHWTLFVYDYNLKAPRLLLSIFQSFLPTPQISKNYPPTWVLLPAAKKCSSSEIMVTSVWQATELPVQALQQTVQSKRHNAEPLTQH